MSELDIEDWAVSDFLRERTVRILDFTCKEDGGTGIKIRLKDRIFIATAAHVISKNHEFRILIPGRENAFVTTFMNKVVQKESDIGFLEIDEASATLLGGQFVHADDIAVDFPNDTSWKTVVCGYPGQLIGICEKQEGSTVVKSYDFRSMVFFGGTIPKQHWPAQGFSNPPVENREIFLDFSPNAQMERLDLSASPPVIVESNGIRFEPAGMSGGGVWADSRPQGDQLWSPKPLLLGIQRSVNEKGRWLRVTRITYWLELVKSAYPELDLNLE